MKNLISSLFLSLILLFNACKNESETIAFTTTDSTDRTTAEIIRLDSLLFAYPTMNSQQRRNVNVLYGQILKGLSMFLEGNDSIDEIKMLEMSTSPAVQIFTPEVNKLFVDVDTERLSLGKVIETIKANGLDIPADKFATVCWSDRRSIAVIDTISTVYIALNHYLGKDNEAYAGWPEFRRKLKNRDMIPIDVSEALIGSYYPYESKNGENEDVLSRLLYEGAVAIAKQSMAPRASLANILGFTDEELEDIIKNETFIWNHLTSENTLFSSDLELLSNLFDLRPNTSFISPDAPGRSVRYIGYRIVKSYLAKHKEVKLKELLSPSFYHQGIEIIKQSGYRPK